MIQLRTLGALDIRGADGQEMRAVLAQPKRVALLVFLLLATPRGAQRRDKLLPLFWPELDADHARDALSQAVRFLRRSMGDEVVVSNTGDTLQCATDVWCDAIAFEDAIDHGRLTDAVDLYRGDLLDSFYVAHGAEFERWLVGERQRLRRRFQDALSALATQSEAARDHRAAAEWWRRLAAEDPYNSSVALHLMRALVAAGDPGGAIQHARVHETLLREDLDAGPDAELTRFVRLLQSADVDQQLQAGEAVVASSVAVNGGAASVSAAASAFAADARKPNRFGRRSAVITVGVVATFLVAASGAFALKTFGHDDDVPAIRSIAVLPLENIAGDSAQRALVEGMHDALITELARYPDLNVISRTSMIRFRDSRKPLAEIAREVKVDGLVVGSVLRERDRVSVRVQLVHGPTERHLWAQRYERDIRDVLVLQGDLADAITRELRTVATPAPRIRPVVGQRDSTERELYVREHYLRGRHAEISRSQSGLLAAKAAFRRAIERDSSFAPAYAGLATAYYLLADNDLAPVRIALDSAGIMARWAVELDSTSSETRTALGIVLATNRDFPNAEREFKRAIELSPSDARAHYWYSNLLVALGRGDEALREANLVERIDPFAPRGVTAMQRYARWLISGTRADMQIPVAQRPLPILRIEPGEPIALAWQALDLAEQGNCGDALSQIERARRLTPDTNMRMLGHVAPVYWTCGRRARARDVLRAMQRRADAHDYGFRIAMVFAHFGERDSAFAWIRRHAWTLGNMTGLSADRRTDPLRNDPRYAQLLEDLGLRPRQGRR